MLIAQIQGAYKTILSKFPDVEIIPLAVQMISDGMHIALLGISPTNVNELIIKRYIKVKLLPVINAWQPVPRKKRKE